MRNVTRSSPTPSRPIHDPTAALGPSGADASEPKALARATHDGGHGPTAAAGMGGFARVLAGRMASGPAVMAHQLAALVRSPERLVTAALIGVMLGTGAQAAEPMQGAKLEQCQDWGHAPVITPTPKYPWNDWVQQVKGRFWHGNRSLKYDPIAEVAAIAMHSTGADEAEIPARLRESIEKRGAECSNYHFTKGDLLGQPVFFAVFVGEPYPADSPSAGYAPLELEVYSTAFDRDGQRVAGMGASHMLRATYEHTIERLEAGETIK